MSEDANEDTWLYGTENLDSKNQDFEESKSNEYEKENNVNVKQGVNLDVDISNREVSGNKCLDNLRQISIDDDPAMEMEEQEENQVTSHKTIEDKILHNGKKVADEDYSEDESDDDINIVIGRIKTGPLYTKQRQNFLVPGVICQTEKKQCSGKFSIEEFESMGFINGLSAQEFSIDSLDEKPWRKPGADITDYFNYGFNEETWKAYCERQKRIRVNESGVGLQALTVTLSGIPNPSSNTYIQQQGQTSQVIPSVGFITNNRTLTPISNSEKYAGQIRPRPPFQQNLPISRENTIQVMTAECRDYSKINFVGSHDDSFFENDSYNYGFEPTQDLQWLNQTNKSWQPSGIKELPLDPTLVNVQTDVSNQVERDIVQNSIISFTPPSRISPIGMVSRSNENLMLPPKTSSPFSSRDWNKDWEREKEVHFKDRERDARNRDKDRIKDGRSRGQPMDRSDRDRSDKEWNREKDRSDDKKRNRDKSREKNKEKSEETDRVPEETREKRRKDHGRERERERDRSKRDNSRLREKAKRRSKSHDKNGERKERRDKKKSKEKVEMN